MAKCEKHNEIHQDFCGSCRDEKEIENRTEHIRIFLYADKKPSQEFVEWRADLETAISDLVQTHIKNIYRRWKWHFENHDVPYDRMCIAEFIAEANKILEK